MYVSGAHSCRQLGGRRRNGRPTLNWMETPVWDIHEFDAIDSTNRWLADRCAEGAPGAMVAIAALQTAGRGRLGRTWTAPPNSGLLMSVLLRPHIAVDQWHLLSLHLAIAALETVRALGADVSLKWPNDLLATRVDGEERKLAGILAQGIHGAHPGVVVGIGLNLVRPPDLPEEIAARGVWLEELVASTPSPRELAAPLLARFGEVLTWPVPRVLDVARSNCSTLGRQVRVELEGSDVHGVATGIGDDGALLVDTGSGVVASFHAGDVVHVR